MYYDNWSETSFEQATTGYCICPHCKSQVPIKDPRRSDICPECNQPIVIAPTDYNIHLYNGTRDHSDDNPIKSFLSLALVSSIWAVVGVMLALTNHWPMAILLFGVTVFLLIIAFKMYLSRTLSRNRVNYPATIIGVSYATGSFTQVPTPEGMQPSQDTDISKAPTLFVRYTVLYKKNGANAVSYIYDFASRYPYEINDKVIVVIRNEKQIWIADEKERHYA